MRCFSGVGSLTNDSSDVSCAAASAASAAASPVMLIHFSMRSKMVSRDFWYWGSSCARFAIYTRKK